MANNKRNKVRIIAGSLRGRMVPFGDAAGLRPTGDRLRETLFSWLQPALPGSCCLDMFAGSGVLGFEAISRGAEELVLLEKDQKVCAQLQQSVQHLALTRVGVHCRDSTRSNAIPAPASGRYSIVFIDPPFDARLHDKAIHNLISSQLLADDACVVVECNKRNSELSLPLDWQLLKEKTAGEVLLRLYRVLSVVEP